MHVGGTNMGDQWLWEARELDPHEHYNEPRYLQLATGVWLPKTSIIRRNCLVWWGGQFNTFVGNLICLGQRFYNVTTQKTQWWGSPNHTEQTPIPCLISLISNRPGMMLMQNWMTSPRWENCLHCTSPKLVSILCVGVNLSILLPAPTC
jgi:hypothetical protein